MADNDRASTGARASDLQSALNPLERAVRQIVEAVGKETSNPLIKTTAIISKGEKYYSKLDQLKALYEKGQLDEAIVRHILLSSELMGIETEAAEMALDRNARNRANDPRPPLSERVVTGVYDP